MDIQFKKYFRLTILKRVKKKNGHQYWRCICVCGTYKTIAQNHILSGKIKSCGCYKKEFNRLSHGEAAFRKLYRSYKYNAYCQNRSFRIPVNLFRKLVKKKCFYCKIEPCQIFEDPQLFGNFKYNGLDRINNNLGYNKNNIVTCCGICNRAKSVMTQREFLDWIQRFKS